MKNLTMPNLLLRLEGTAVLIITLIFYAQLDYSWLTFALLILAPDLAMLGYVINNQVGSWSYNLFHTYTVPLFLGLLAISLANPIMSQIALIWLAHIGMDRVVGYGLKYPTAFKKTHLSHI